MTTKSYKPPSIEKFNIASVDLKTRRTLIGCQYLFYLHFSNVTLLSPNINHWRVSKMETDKNICRRLYHCLCETIGSEEVVKARRQFYATVDYFTEKKHFSLITSGSRAEGLEMRSDIDVMCLFRLVNVSEERTDDSFLIPNNFVMDTEDCKPCFTQLKGNSCHYDALVNWLSSPYGQELRFESGRIRYWIVSIVGLFRPVTLHGPCASDMNELEGFLDITLIGKSMDVHTKYPNKYRYKLLKQLLPYLFMGLHTDSVASWMYLATYYYCFGQYRTSLKLIFHALKECTNDKLFNTKCTLTASNISTIEKEGVRQKIWKRRHLYKHHVVNEITFYYNSRVIPPELDVQVTTIGYIPSRVYIHFLRFLCLYRLQEDFQCMHAIEDLRLSVFRTHLEDNECALGEAYHCLATALVIFGQSKEARFYFDKSNSYKEKNKGCYF
ncbi:unnamed protein product [Mytilus coruscus]|uniref:Mab-21-like HhH/H2TH-like domain-containing protein n=1 Tax=Mytilus coruscus TaxID=42192 RepID=A0A6J8DPL1_MYTCO|nr:unnamed protein product [Mytilus coruscus]